MKQNHQQPLSAAELEWDQQGLPHCRQFKDYYVSGTSGPEEVRYIFIDGNRLGQRWQQLQPQQHFTVAETGFGTGLNFLCSWQLWRQLAPPTARLHYLSAEKHPLKLEDLRRALALWPQLGELVTQLIDVYPPPCPGFHRLRFDQGRVSLTLLLGDAEQLLSQLQGRVDAWYLDGFAPSRNPDMWSDGLFETIAAHSRESTTFSTFTAAGWVRRGLAAAGFRVEKAVGFANKREMLKGRLERQPPPVVEKRWFSPTQLQIDGAPRALVIGAGLAGCASARALADRGWQVQLLDRGPGVASEASGNPQGILYAKLPAKPTLASRIHLAGYQFSLQLLQRLLPAGENWSPCGVLQLAVDDQALAKQQKLLALGQYPQQLVRGLDAAEASAIAGVSLSRPGLFFPASGWVNPPSLCRALADHEAIHSRFQQPIEQINRDAASGHWQVLDAAGQVIASAPVLIVANAHGACQFTPLQWLPLKRIRGQVSSFAQPPATQLNTVLCGNGYISPAWQQRFCFGATFDLHSLDTQVRAEDDLRNLAHTAELAPQLATRLADTAPSQRHGRVGFRCSAPDYLPLVGAVPDYGAFVEAYAELRNNAKARIEQPPPLLPGLFINLAHGSKGLITAPLGAEFLASQICREPLPLEVPLGHALNPARFIVKDLIQRAI